MYMLLVPNTFHLPAQAGSRIQILSRTKISFLPLALLCVAWEYQPGQKNWLDLHQHSPPWALPTLTGIPCGKRGKAVGKQDAQCLLLT